jgi:AAA15 family ATPase/GTPase
MKITKLKLQNFRTHENLILHPQDVNTLSGANGTGKTSIKEAILFALYGRNMSGSNIGLSEQIKTGKTALAVEIEFEGFSIIRKKSSSKTALFYIDGSQPSIQSTVAQRDLETQLPEPELFQAIFDVGYFGQLSESEQRNLILGVTPDVKIKELAHQEFSWLEEVEKDFPVFFGEYETERARFLRLRRGKQAELDSISVKIETNVESVDDYDFQIEELEGKIAKLNATSIDSVRCDKCNQVIFNPALEEHNKALQEARWEMDRLTQTKQRASTGIENTKKEAKVLEKNICDLTKVIDMLGPKGLPAIEMDLKLKPILEFLKKEIKGFDIITLEEVKSTLEWKECFKILVNNVQYDNLSTGEKIKVDIALSKLLDKLSSETVNMFFIDHVESLTGKIPTLEGQVFKAEVSEKKQLIFKTE